jgi:hypothetical protein
VAQLSWAHQKAKRLDEARVACLKRYGILESLVICIVEHRAKLVDQVWGLVVHKSDSLDCRGCDVLSAKNWLEQSLKRTETLAVKI